MIYTTYRMRQSLAMCSMPEVCGKILMSCKSDLKWVKGYKALASGDNCPRYSQPHCMSNVKAHFSQKK